jgi:hypothetical protein
MNQFASSYWAMVTFNNMQEELHELQRPRKQLYYQLSYRKGNKPPIARDTKALQRDQAEQIRTRFCISLANRHVTIKLYHYFVPYSVIVEDCLITHVKHRVEWFHAVCGESNLYPSRSFVRTTVAAFFSGNLLLMEFLIFKGIATPHWPSKSHAYIQLVAGIMCSSST